MYSIRNRLILVLAIGFVILIAAAGLATEQLVARGLTQEFDETLLAKAHTLAALLEQEEGRIVFDYQGEFMPEFERAERPHYYEILLGDGTPLVRSTHLEQDLAPLAGLERTVATRDLRLPDGRAGRAVQLRFSPRGDDDDEPSTSPGAAVPDVVLLVARDRVDLDDRIARLRLTLLGGGAAAALLGAALVWRALVRGFRPIRSIAAQVGALDADSLGVRIAVPGPPRELAPVVDQLNALLGRLEASFLRERRFAGNVAHELRTPISELRSLAEVGERWPDDVDATRGYFADVQAIAYRMERLVADLLLLARLEAGVEPVIRSPVGLRAVVEDAWRRRGGNGALEGRTLRLEIAQELEIESDPDKLGIMLDNLVENAVRHGLPGCEIRCEARREGLRFRLSVANPAEPLSGDDFSRLTEPFWRKDEARTSGEHAGLGLSLVAALAGLLDLDLAFHQDGAGWFEVRLEGAVVGLRGARGEC